MALLLFLLLIIFLGTVVSEWIGLGLVIGATIVTAANTL